MSGKNRIQRIILIITDTLRAKNVGLYNKFNKVTPNIDSLGKNGIVFLNAYATITKTDPSITSIMTGKYPLTLGIVNHGKRVREEEVKNLSTNTFLPEILKKNEYFTAAIDWTGRWHNRGYDFYSGGLVKNLKNIDSVFAKFPILRILMGIDKISLKTLKRDFFSRFYYSFFVNPKIPYDPADIVVNQAMNILDKTRSKKLFLYLHLWDAHEPHIRSKGLKNYLLDNVEDTYNREVKFLDNQLGRLFLYLKEKNLFSKSLIIFTSDHGENLDNYEIPLGHTGLSDDVIRVPLIIHIPKVSPKKINNLVQHVDIFPTILNLLGIKEQTQLDGKSLYPLILKGKNIRDLAYFEDLVPKEYFFKKNLRRRGIKIGNTKYVETFLSDTEDIFELTINQNISQSYINIFKIKNIYQEEIKSKRKSDPTFKKKLLEFTNSLLQKRLEKKPKLLKKIDKTKSILKKAIDKYKYHDIAVAWKGGKDTTVMMHILKGMYKDKIPFKVFFNDSTMEFRETYEFIKKIKKLWGFRMIVIKHDRKELEEYHSTKDLNRKKELSRLMKITAINKALKKYKFKGFILGIRRDENPARKNEKYFSKRKDHIRIHPMLDWTEEDIWDYIKTFGVPYLPLYDKGYRSVGEKPFTVKSKEEGDERSGRDQEKEEVMARLRQLGYW